MNKSEFLAKLCEALSLIPEKDSQDRISFYSEMIDDRIEEGLSEEEAVSDVGSIDEIVSQILASHNATTNDKTEPKRKLRIWAIIFLVLGSPIWISLLISAAAVAFSLYMALWSAIISFWAAEVSLFAVAFGTILPGTVFLFSENVASGVAIIGAGIVCAGLSIFFFFACKALTKGTVSLTKKIALRIKKFFTKKEAE